MKQVNLDRRIRWIRLLTLLLFVGLAVRLFQIQVAQRERFDAHSRQHKTALTERVKRGKILDRNYRDLALSKNVYSLFVYPRHYRDLARRGRLSLEKVEQRKRILVDILARRLNRPPAKIRRLLDSPRGFEWVERRVDYDVIAQIEADLKEARLGWWPRSGLDFEVEERRYYPRGELAAHVIGYTNIDGEGMDGVELAYNENLRSHELERETIKDGKGRAIDPVALGAEEPTTSDSVVLTIDERIQFVLEKELKAQAKAYRAEAAVGIVMNPKTGEVLALANVPTFDLNRYNDPKVTSLMRRNRAIWWPYEPGSVFKTLTLAALLDAGRVDPNERIFCENGSYTPNPRIKPIRDTHPYGWLTFAEVIQKSSNIGTLKVTSEAFTLDEFRAYVERFHLNEKTGIDLPYERRGNLAALSDRSGYAIYFAPWGQGISMTPLQMLTVVNAIANDGVLVRPRVVREILDEKGTVKRRFGPVPVGRVIRPESARAATEILVGVVEKGSGGAARIDGVRIAGKTGTSQKVADDGSGYERGAYVSSFVGFFPADDPEYSILILIDEPRGEYYGGRVAAPVFKRVAEQLLRYERMDAVLTRFTDETDVEIGAVR